MKDGDYTIRRWADSAAIKNSINHIVDMEYRAIYECLDSKSAMKACHTLDAKLVKPLTSKN